MYDMSFYEFELDWQDYARRNPQQRRGQALSNYIGKIDPALFLMLSEAGVDPFFDDAAIPDALAFLKENWDD